MNADLQMQSTEIIRLDPELRRFRCECMSCQSLGIASWATKIMRARRMTMADLTRCFVLGFEG
ncbi:MAG: hypothetical protein L6Q93_16075 [Phycisphaerae bacterium]|nr:hypothetical protein [Phycisphaerae bacterium]NUQ10603.1 hypothetical protein [Phycisphaerae bacterium]